jgi:hypothetical protein
MEKMTIHRALSELKLIDTKVTKKLSDLDPIGGYQKGKLVNGRTPEADFKSLAQGNWDSMTDLLNKKNKIKSAIVLSNALTKVTVANVEMSVAEAITKKTNIEAYRTIIDSLRFKVKKVQGAINDGNNKVKDNCQKVVEATVGKDNIQTSADQVAAISKSFMETNEIHTFDPLGIEAKIEELEKDYMEFKAEVDAVLSESNATTFIEI